MACRAMDDVRRNAALKYSEQDEEEKPPRGNAWRLGRDTIPDNGHTLFYFLAGEGQRGEEAAIRFCPLLILHRAQDGQIVPKSDRHHFPLRNNFYKRIFRTHNYRYYAALMSNNTHFHCNR